MDARSAGDLGRIHTVAVRATDRLGNTTTKTQSIETQKDVTKPNLEVGGELISAPEGWVQQEGYKLHASATDAGYGVTSLTFKIDGSVVASLTQPSAGSCPASFAEDVDISEYEGGRMRPM